MTILVVDDNPLVCDVVARMIAARGHDTITAESGEAALALSADHEIHGAIIDVDMPGIDGFETCRALMERASAMRRLLPVWCMTGVVRPDSSARATRAGALGLLAKPFTMTELFAAFEGAWAMRVAAV